MEQTNSDDVKLGNQEAPRQNKHTGARIVSMLNDALENDGRGGFGCIVVNPPAFLSEDEALDLIRKEFIKAGLKPDDQSITVDQVALPETATCSNYKRDRKGQPVKDKDGKWIKEPLSYHPPQECTFDLSFNYGAVRIEYISKKDYADWRAHTGLRSTVSSYDFSGVAKRFSASLSGKEDLGGGIYGVFFDPMARPRENLPRPNWYEKTEEERENWRSMTKEERQKWTKEKLEATKGSAETYRADRQKLADLAAKERLQLQIQHFLAELKNRQATEPVN